jgi:hypothetical protein
MLKITWLLKQLDFWNCQGDTERYDKALKEFAWRAWNLAGQGKLFTVNSKGKIVRVDGKGGGQGE